MSYKCITSNPRFARLIMSAHEEITRALESTILWLKFSPFRLKAIVEIPNDVNQIPITGNTANAKCKERELLNELYCHSRRPKYPCAATIEYVSVSCNDNHI